MLKYKVRLFQGSKIKIANFSCCAIDTIISESGQRIDEEPLESWVSGGAIWSTVAIDIENAKKSLDIHKFNHKVSRADTFCDYN